jgi:hypothetical protein
MGVREDREEFNTTGLRGLLRRVMSEREEAFIKELPGGWQGELLSERPPPGSGPYLHYKRGNEVLRYSNASPEDNAFTYYKAQL